MTNKNGYSLINVYEEENGMVCGAWLQNFTGNLKDARKWADETETANSNKIKVAVVEKIAYGAQWDIVNSKRLA